MKLCIVPARGGSKRIPRKNIRPFAGKPMMAYSIEVALNSGLFDRVIVSTDDDEIASLANGYGAETPFIRPAELADDHAGTNDVVRHAISWFQQRDIQFEYACCIYATAPFLQVGYLRKGIDLLTASTRSFSFSVTSYPFSVQRALRIVDGEYLEAIWPENNLVRSQDLEEAYHDAGQFYWGRCNAFMDNKILYSPASIPVVLPRHLVQDIDTVEDWDRAELMYRAWQLGKQVD
jgi:N-acylneuraminate cytidylyltransferase